MSVSSRAGVFFAQVVGTTGAFAAPPAAPAPGNNPVNNVVNACTPARTGAGVYTLTFTNPMPITEYKYSGDCIGAAISGNWQFAVVGAVVTVRTSLAAVATDEDFWIEIEPIQG